VQEGKWEISMTIQPKGISLPMPAVKINQCITKEEVADNKITLPSASGKKGDCETKDARLTGNTTTWSVVCKDGSKSDGEITYKGTTYDGTLTMTLKNGSKSTTNIKAKRVGECN